MLDALGKALSIGKNEWRKVMLLSGYSASALGVMVIIQSLITALFLEAYDTSYLPYLFASQAIFQIVYTLVSTNRSSSSARKTDSTARLLIMLASVIGAARLVVGLKASWIIFALYIVLQTASELLVVNSWIVAMSQINSREAKRLLPVISSGGRIGALLGGMAVSSLAIYVGTENLLILCVIVIGGMLAMARAMHSAPALEDVGARKKDKGKKKEKGLAGSMSEIARDLATDRLILSFVVIFSALIVANTIIDYQFKGVLKATYTKDQIAAFVGAFYLFLSVMGFVFQLFLTSRLLVRLGLAAGIALMPALMGAISIGFLMVPGIWVITGVRVVENVLKYSVYKSATGLLFMPYPKLKREDLNITVEGIFKPAAVLSASLLMIVLNKFSVSLQLMSTVSIAACIVAAGAAFKLKPYYIEKLKTSLSNRRVRLSEDAENANLVDQEFLSVLEANLQSSEIAGVQFSLQFIREKRLPINAEKLYQLMKSENAVIATEAIATLGAIGNSKDSGAIYDILGVTSDEAVTVACLRALRSIGDTRIDECIETLLEAECGDVRVEAVLLMLTSADTKVADLAERMLMNMLESDAPANLASAAFIIGEAGLVCHQERLTALFGNADMRVVREAVGAAGKFARTVPADQRDPLLLERLTECFSISKAEQQTRTALAAYGTDSIPVLMKHYGTVGPRRQLSIISTLGSIHDVLSVQELLGIAESGDEPLRHRAIAMLSRLHAFSEGKEAARRIYGAIFERAGHCDRLLDAIQMLKEVPDDVLPQGGRFRQFLIDEVRYKTRQTLEDVFNLLGLCYDRRTIYRIFLNTMGGTSEDRANALELFENIVEKNTATRITPLIESLSGLAQAGPAARLTPESGLAGWLEPIGDVWLTTLAGWITKGERCNMDVIEKIFFLKKLNIFSQLSGEQLKPIADMFEEVMLPAGEMVFSQGDPSDNLYVILSGCVAVSVESRKVATLGVGEYFGEMALLDDEPRSATITLEEDTELLSLYKEDFYEILDTYPDISRSIIRTLSMRLRVAMGTGS